MTRQSLLDRLRRIRGLRLLDPWGTRAEVWSFRGDSVWLNYPGLPVPFERSVDELVDAASGSLRTDYERQFVVRFKTHLGIGVEFLYEPRGVR